jgi:hypothetical protein
MYRSRRRLLELVAAAAAVAVVAVVAVVVTSSDDESPPGPRPEGTLPLLGTPGEVPQRPALAVKIDTTAGGRPQTGLTRADVVFEEVVEGGLTRLLAVYHSQDPEAVGPVRSARSTDISLLADLGRPLFAWSGANPTFADAVATADLIDVGAAAAPDAYRRAPDRPAPYDLYAAPGTLRAAGDAAAGGAAGEGGAGGGAESAAGSGGPPPPLFEYRPAGRPRSGPGVQPATNYRTTVSGMLSTEIAWDWDQPSGSWVRTQDGTPHVDAAGERVRAANVIVRTTPYRDSGVRDSVGAVVPEAETVGEGDVLLLSGGQAQPGRWHQPSEDAPTTYTATDGTPLRLAPGPTWVEVLPPDTGNRS